MRHRVIGGVILVFVGAVCFSSKAVIVKLAYRHSVDPVSLLALRMLFSLPFFLAIGFFSRRSQKKAALTGKEWGHVVLLGFVGYY